MLLRALDLVTQTLLIGSVLFRCLLAERLAHHLLPGDAFALQHIAGRYVRLTAIVNCLIAPLGPGLTLAVLIDTTGLAFVEAASAQFIAAALVTFAASVLILWLGWRSNNPNRHGFSLRDSAQLLAALSILAAAVIGSHAVARLEDRPMLMAATAAHALGAALWIGGLPVFLATLRGPLSETARIMVGRRYSLLAGCGVLLIVTGSAGFFTGYINAPDAIYGTAYGAMAATKGTLFVLLLCLGAGNFLVLHGAVRLPEFGTLIVRRFVEAEIILGLAALATAASLTSVPPAIDLDKDRVPLEMIIERMTPLWPRLSSPAHSDLAIPALQAQLDQEWAVNQQRANRTQAFTPGQGVLPPRNAFDIAWSEYNHHWAGIIVMLIGIAAFADATGRIPFARHWPLLFLLLAVFLFLRSDPEVWPLGDIGLLASLTDPEVVQHRIFVVLTTLFALAEWGARLGHLRAGRAQLILPASMVAGGVLLLTHSHAITNITEQLLIELSHLAIAVLSVTAGAARWVELRLPGRGGQIAARIWPMCFILIGAFLLFYRES